MVCFRILEGLPTYGPIAEQFSATGQGTHRQGMVVEIQADEREPAWVGNFQPGLKPFSDVLEEPGAERLIVVAGGQGYVIDPRTRKCTGVFGGAIEHAWRLSPEVLLFSDGLRFEALGMRGLLWRSRRISWDGLRNLRFEGNALRGEAYVPADEGWEPFALDLTTGEVNGGSYPRVLTD